MAASRDGCKCNASSVGACCFFESAHRMTWVALLSLSVSSCVCPLALRLGWVKVPRYPPAKLGGPAGQLEPKCWCWGLDYSIYLRWIQEYSVQESTIASASSRRLRRKRGVMCANRTGSTVYAKPVAGTAAAQIGHADMVCCFKSSNMTLKLGHRLRSWGWCHYAMYARK